MPDPLTAAELDALKALAGDATEGPWHSAEHLNAIFAEGDRPIGSIYPIGYEHPFVQRDANAAFVAAAREAVPRLVTDLERARELLREHQAQSALAGCGRNRNEIAAYLREVRVLKGRRDA